MKRLLSISGLLTSLAYTVPASAHVESVPHVHQEITWSLSVLLIAGALAGGVIAYRAINKD